MKVTEVIKTRRSGRAFNANPIPRGLIEELIDCARLAPSARNVQPWEFVAVTNKETLESLGAVADTGRFIGQSTCCIAVFCQDTKYYLEDGSAATENILIAAQDLGLSACWVAGDKKPYCDKVKEILGAPADSKLISLIPLGYPYTKEEPRMPQKRTLKEVLHWEKW